MNNNTYWVGIVEKRDDDKRIGRCKVRIFDHHTASKTELPTDALPWAYALEPLSGSLYSTPIEGETVFGVFLDGEARQQPLMLGRLPSQAQRTINHPEGEGFRDARTESELAASPRQLYSEFQYSTDGSGATAFEYDAAFPYPAYGSSKGSTPFLADARNAIPQQLSPSIKAQQAAMTRFVTAKGQTWFELPSKYAAVYPFNKVFESESLHVFELDDTPSAERVRLMHRSGSGVEWSPDGSRVEKIVQDAYTIVLKDSKIGIYGASDITVHGDATLMVKGNRIEHIDGDYHLSVEGDMKTIIKGSHTSRTDGSSKHKVSGDFVVNSAENVVLKGSKLHLNPGSGADVDELSDFDLPAVPADSTSFANQDRIRTQTGSETAPQDDKDESEQADLTGQVATSNVQPESITCPLLSEKDNAMVNGDSRYRMQLSRYFQLADLSVRCIYPHHVNAQAGLKAEELICNLAHLSQNVLDKLMAQYPGLRVNCGFRAYTTGKSQHEVGEAADLQWPSIKLGSLSKYLEIAHYIKDSLPFDQLILEHGSTIWLHVSLKRTGNNRKQVLTMFNGRYEPGLSLKGRS